MNSNIDAKKLAAGDADEFNKLRKAVERPIHSTLKKRFGPALNEADIADINAAVMYEEHVSIREGTYEIPEGGTPEGRVLQRADWRARDLLRARKRKEPQLPKGDTRPPIVSYDDPKVEQAERRHLSTDPSADEEEQADHEKDIMRRAFASLSEEDKNILQSSLAEGLSAREIGEQLGISRDTAQQQIGRSKERARKLFENLCKEDRGRKVTKKGDPLKLLGEMFRSGEMPPTEGEVQKSMRETTVEVSQVSLDRAHRKFVDKVFGYLHPYPVRRVTGRETFGLWLEARRRDAILIREDIARALGKDEFYVKRLEIGETNPLSLNSSDAADIATLFRIHIDGIAQLISNSEAIRGRGGEIKVPVPSNVAELAREQGKPSDDPLSWLGALYEEFERRQATHLLP